MEWFRFYHDALNDPKVQRLDGESFKAWVNLLCVSSQQPERGRLPNILDISFALRMSENDALDMVRRLQNAQLLDEDEQGLSIHNWSSRQKASDDVTLRVQKHREKETLRGGEGETLPKRSSNVLEQNRVEKKREEKILRASAPTKKLPGDELPDNGPAQHAVKLWAEMAETKPTNYSKAVGIAQKLMEANVTDKELRALYEYLATDDFWRGEGFDLGTALSQLEKFRSTRRKKPERTCPPGKAWDASKGRCVSPRMVGVVTAG
jgi:hypothetical protein